MDNTVKLVNDILETATYYLKHADDEYFKEIWSEDIERFKERADKIDKRKEENTNK